MRRRKRGGERRIRGEVDERMRGGEEEEKERRGANRGSEERRVGLQGYAERIKHKCTVCVYVCAVTCSDVSKRVSTEL